MYENFAKNELKNNLFEYATSELSQDAFICWLASYAHEDAEKDEALNECARKMLEMFVEEFEGKNFKLLNVERQVDNVDVLLTVDCEGVIYKIIVEDKTYTDVHDNQLNRYRDNLKKQKIEDKFIIKGVYYKTGFQSDLSSVKEAEYQPIGREEMLKLMQPYAEKTNNQIFISYYNYWNNKQKLVESFKALPVVDWSWWAVYGFYDYLKEKLEKSDMVCWYGDVSNPAGGFECLAIWLDNDQDKIIVKDTAKEVSCSVYFHLEFHRIYNAERNIWERRLQSSLKLQICAGKEYKDYGKKEIVNDGINIQNVRDKVLEKLYSDKNLNKHYFEKPKRNGNGRHITVGVIEDFAEDAESLEKKTYEIVKDYKEILTKLKN